MKLMVIMLDTFDAEMSVVHLGQTKPFGRRFVSIELTPDQVKKLKPRHLGKSGGTDRFEELGEVWLEGGGPEEQEGGN